MNLEENHYINWNDNAIISYMDSEKFVILLKVPIGNILSLYDD